MIDSVNDLFSFLVSALSCTFIQIVILFALILVNLALTLKLKSRVGKIEKVASVRDFLKNDKKKK